VDITGLTVQHTTYVCPQCRSALWIEAEQLRCTACATAFPTKDGIADFAGGRYYDVFNENVALPEYHVQGLQLEEIGAISRISDFYLPKLERLRSRSRRPLTVLDAGCGNGVSVDELRTHGLAAWGIDLSALRRWQWGQRTHRACLAVADLASLPFQDGYFDAILCSGVIEHIGVVESRGSKYTVTIPPERDAAREAFLRELVRVLAPNGMLYIDCPNGSFPVDFWHGSAGGNLRFHSPREGFLPTFHEIEQLANRVDNSLVVTADSPLGRLRFRQVGRFWYGRVFSLPVQALFRLMSTRVGRWLARSPLNPYLVVRLERVRNSQGAAGRPRNQPRRSENRGSGANQQSRRALVDPSLRSG
jgi:SAM-dependent methyltransferase